MPQKNTKTALRRRQVCYNSSSVAAVRLCWEGITTEKVKAFLARGARHLPGYEVWPNPQLGYGALCVRDSLPI